MSMSSSQQGASYCTSIHTTLKCGGLDRIVIKRMIHILTSERKEHFRACFECKDVTVWDHRHWYLSFVGGVTCELVIIRWALTTLTNLFTEIWTWEYEGTLTPTPFVLLRFPSRWVF